MEKQETRRLIAQLKRQHTEQELAALSLAATDRLLANPHVEAARTILLYYSMRGEVDTHAVVESLYGMGKVVLLPRVTGDGLMELIPYAGEPCLQPSGKFHILEPQGEPFADYPNIEVAVVPGIAFTADGRRMGRGGGYYDRLLPQLPKAWKIGLCFPFQILGDIPTTPYDVRMDEIVG